MKTKRVLRYYCDHCRKSGCGKAAMIRHESRCIRNPNRVCGFCRQNVEDGGNSAKPLPELIALILSGGGVEKCKEAAQGCPACVLAAIVQSKAQEYEPDDEGSTWIAFDYKKAVAQFWDDRRQENHGYS